VLKPIDVVPDGQLVDPEVHGTLLSPLVTSWNTDGLPVAKL
jgi:hypothetical protein